MQSAPRGVRGEAGEGAGGGGRLEAWPKQTSFAEKKKSQTKTPDATESTPPLGPRLRTPCPACLLGHAPQPRASLGLKVRANRVPTLETHSQWDPWIRQSPGCRRGSVLEVAWPFGGRRDPDLHLANGRRRWGRDRDPVRANEAGGRRKHMALRVLPDLESG